MVVSRADNDIILVKINLKQLVISIFHGVFRPVSYFISL
ncbi:Uncharacterized protein YR821_2826 [Yersinia ruckeri]|nr:hypothetical protein yruck0001_4380 [Yersinia ruckeri ATCC 29473]QTD77743.1 Uncharacterized protein YR821_2826 [Yersinia ruckeri]